MQRSGSGLRWHSDTALALARDGDLDSLKWAASEGCPMDLRLCPVAARAGRTDVLEWLAERGVSCDSLTCIEAAAAGQLDTLRWLLRRGTPWPEPAGLLELAAEAVRPWLAETAAQQAVLFCERNKNIIKS